MLRVCNEWENFKDSNCSLGETLSAFLAHSNILMYGVIYEGCSGFCLMKRRLGRPRQHMNQQHRMCHPPPPCLSSPYIFSPGITGWVCSWNILSDDTHFHCWNAVLKDWFNSKDPQKSKARNTEEKQVTRLDDKNKTHTWKGALAKL